MAKVKVRGEFQIVDWRCFGPFARYRLDRCRDRFGSVVYMVLDAEVPDETGLPSIIRQTTTEEEALAGLITR